MSPSRVASTATTRPSPKKKLYYRYHMNSPRTYNRPTLPLPPDLATTPGFLLPPNLAAASRPSRYRTRRDGTRLDGTIENPP
jgi:hypothetical protein